MAAALGVGETLLDAKFKSGKRVFESLGHLTEWVFERAPERYRDPSTMAPSISLILRGKKAGSVAVIQAIIDYVEDSGLQEDGSCETCRMFRSTLRTDVEGGLNFVCANPDLTLLTRTVESAKHIVAALPGGVFSSRSGRCVLEIFARRMGLLTDPPDKTFRVELWFCDDFSAKKGWWLLLNFLDELEPGKSHDHITSLIEASSDQRLVLGRVGCVATGMKVIVAEPNQVNEAVGFVFNISTEVDPVFFMSLGPDGTRDWVNCVFANEACDPTLAEKVLQLPA